MTYLRKKTINKKGIKKLCAILLSAAMVMGLASCGKAGGPKEEEGSSARSGYVYTTEYITLENGGDIRTYNAQIRGDSLYYANTVYSEDYSTSERYICEYSLSEKKVASQVQVGDGGGYISAFQVASDGTIYVLNGVTNFDSEGNYLSENAVMTVYDAQGSVLWEQDLTKELEDAYVNNMTVDDENRLYLVLDNRILLYSAEGAPVGEVQIEGDAWISGTGIGKDGKCYVSYRSYNTAAGTAEMVLAEIDFDGKKIGKTYENFPSGNNSNLVRGDEYDFLADDGTHVYGYNLADQEKEELFSWVGCDINPSYVDNMGVAGDGRILALIRDWSTDEISAAYLTKTDASTLPQKVELVVGTLSESQELQTAVVNFNRQSDTCHLTIKNYLSYDVWTETTYSDAIAAMNTAIASTNNCPDIIVLTNVNIESLAAKGVFEDLAPYLQKSSVLNEDDFFASALDGYSIDGRLVGIPHNFYISTLVGKASDLGEEAGWTLSELVAYAKAHPESRLVDFASRDSILSLCLQFTQDNFIDWSTGNCHFDSDEFKELLEFVADYPEEFDWESYGYSSTPLMVQSGEILLEEVAVRDLNGTQMYPEMFGEDVNFIGYPTPDGSNGCVMNSSNAMAISAKAKDKEAAWSFLEYFLNSENDMFSWGLPSRVSELEKMIEDELTVQYLTDEDGNQILDDDGNPIEIGSGGGFSYDGWEFTYHRCTQEEIDMVRSLIDAARPVSNVDNTIINIITEEAAAFFAGQKSVDDVVNVIQSRAQVYVRENQ